MVPGFRNVIFYSVGAIVGDSIDIGAIVGDSIYMIRIKNTFIVRFLF